jgi:hypothetical protein
MSFKPQTLAVGEEEALETGLADSRLAAFRLSASIRARAHPSDSEVLNEVSQIGVFAGAP